MLSKLAANSWSEFNSASLHQTQGASHLEIERSHETSHDELGAPRAHGPSPQGGRLPSPTGLEAAHARARGPAPVVT